MPHINKKYFTKLKRKIINFMFMRLNKWIAMFWKYLILCCAYGVIYLMNKKSNYFPLQYIISMTFTKIKYCYMLSIMLVLFFISYVWCINLCFIKYFRSELNFTQPFSDQVFEDFPVYSTSLFPLTNMISIGFCRAFKYQKQGKHHGVLLIKLRITLLQ